MENTRSLRNHRYIYTTYSNTHYSDHLWPSRRTRCLGGFLLSWKPVSGTLPLKTPGAWKPLSAKKNASIFLPVCSMGRWKQKSQLDRTTQHSKVLRRHLGSGLLWEIFHKSFACGNYKASKKLILVLMSSGPLDPRSVLKTSSQRKEKNEKPLARTKLVTKSMKKLPFHLLWWALLFHVFWLWWL